MVRALSTGGYCLILIRPCDRCPSSIKRKQFPIAQVCSEAYFMNMPQLLRDPLIICISVAPRSGPGPCCVKCYTNMAHTFDFIASDFQIDPAINLVAIVYSRNIGLQWCLCFQMRNMLCFLLQSQRAKETPSGSRLPVQRVGCHLFFLWRRNTLQEDVKGPEPDTWAL